jgi:hypothetical protein
MLETKKIILESLESFNESEIKELLNYTLFLKVRKKLDRINNFELKKYKQYSQEDVQFAEEGLEDYNRSLINEDNK